MHQLNDRQNRLQTQAATGQRVQWGEEDPAAMNRALALQASDRTNTQYAKNIDFLKERTTTTLDGIRGLQTILDRAGEIAILADGTKSPDELQAYASELDQMIRQGVETANRQHRGDSLFGGTTSGTPPFVLQEDAAKSITGVTYQGNADSPVLEIAPGTTMPMLVPGSNTTGSGAPGLLADSRTGADFFGHLIALRDHLAAGDTKSIADVDRAALRQDEDNVLNQMASTGAVQARLETARAAATTRSNQLQQAYSGETNVDLAETIVQLTATQTAYRAALQSGASLLNTSLMDFLR